MPEKPHLPVTEHTHFFCHVRATLPSCAYFAQLWQLRFRTMKTKAGAFLSTRPSHKPSGTPLEEKSIVEPRSSPNRCCVCALIAVAFNMSVEMLWSSRSFLGWERSTWETVKCLPGQDLAKWCGWDHCKLFLAVARKQPDSLLRGNRLYSAPENPFHNLCQKAMELQLPLPHCSVILSCWQQLCESLEKQNHIWAPDMLISTAV